MPLSVLKFNQIIEDSEILPEEKKGKFSSKLQQLMGFIDNSDDVQHGSLPHDVQTFINLSDDKEQSKEEWAIALSKALTALNKHNRSQPQNAAAAATSPAGDAEEGRRTPPASHGEAALEEDQRPSVLPLTGSGNPFDDHAAGVLSTLSGGDEEAAAAEEGIDNGHITPRQTETAQQLKDSEHLAQISATAFAHNRQTTLLEERIKALAQENSGLMAEGQQLKALLETETKKHELLVTKDRRMAAKKIEKAAKKIKVGGAFDTLANNMVAGRTKDRENRTEKFKKSIEKVVKPRIEESLKRSFEEWKKQTATSIIPIDGIIKKLDCFQVDAKVIKSLLWLKEKEKIKSAVDAKEFTLVKGGKAEGENELTQESLGKMFPGTDVTSLFDFSTDSISLTGDHFVELLEDSVEVSTSNQVLIDLDADGSSSQSSAGGGSSPAVAYPRTKVHPVVAAVLFNGLTEMTGDVEDLENSGDCLIARGNAEQRIRFCQELQANINTDVMGSIATMTPQEQKSLIRLSGLGAKKEGLTAKDLTSVPGSSEASNPMLESASGSVKEQEPSFSDALASRISDESKYIKEVKAKHQGTFDKFAETTRSSVGIQQNSRRMGSLITELKLQYLPDSEHSRALDTCGRKINVLASALDLDPNSTTLASVAITAVTHTLTALMNLVKGSSDASADDSSEAEGADVMIITLKQLVTEVCCAGVGPKQREVTFFGRKFQLPKKLDHLRTRMLNTYKQANRRASAEEIAAMQEEYESKVGQVLVRHIVKNMTGAMLEQLAYLHPDNFNDPQLQGLVELLSTICAHFTYVTTTRAAYNELEVRVLKTKQQLAEVPRAVQDVFVAIQDELNRLFNANMATLFTNVFGHFSQGWLTPPRFATSVRAIADGGGIAAHTNGMQRLGAAAEEEGTVADDRGGEEKDAAAEPASTLPRGEVSDPLRQSTVDNDGGAEAAEEEEEEVEEDAQEDPAAEVVQILETCLNASPSLKSTETSAKSKAKRTAFIAAQANLNEHIKTLPTDTPMSKSELAAKALDFLEEYFLLLDPPGKGAAFVSFVGISSPKIFESAAADTACKALIDFKEDLMPTSEKTAKQERELYYYVPFRQSLADKKVARLAQEKQSSAATSTETGVETSGAAATAGQESVEAHRLVVALNQALEKHAATDAAPFPVKLLSAQPLDGNSIDSVLKKISSNDTDAAIHRYFANLAPARSISMNGGYPCSSSTGCAVHKAILNILTFGLAQSPQETGYVNASAVLTVANIKATRAEAQSESSSPSKFAFNSNESKRSADNTAASSAADARMFTPQSKRTVSPTDFIDTLHSLKASLILNLVEGQTEDVVFKKSGNDLTGMLSQIGEESWGTFLNPNSIRNILDIFAQLATGQDDLQQCQIGLAAVLNAQQGQPAEGSSTGAAEEKPLVKEVIEAWFTAADRCAVAMQQQVEHEASFEM